MDLQDDESLQGHTEHGGQLTSHHLNHMVNIGSHLLKETLEILIPKCFLNTESPVDLIDSEHNLTWPLVNPVL